MKQKAEEEAKLKELEEDRKLKDRMEEALQMFETLSEAEQESRAKAIHKGRPWQPLESCRTEASLNYLEELGM